MGLFINYLKKIQLNLILLDKIKNIKNNQSKGKKIKDIMLHLYLNHYMVKKVK